MPHAEIMSADSGKKYREPHERESGPWDDYEKEEAGRTLERAEKIKGNAKFVEAVAKHHEAKAATHRKLAKGMRGHMKRGLVSERAMERAAHKHG